MILITAANRYAALAAAIFLAAMLLATISITTFDPRWVVFLAGVLAAAILAGVSRTVNARWLIARRTSQLNATRAKLASEVGLRTRAEKALARVRNNVDLVDEELPAMLAYLDGEERVRYHNHAFARLVGRNREEIDGGRFEEIIGRAAYLETGPCVKDALRGKEARHEYTHAMRVGDACRLSVRYFPRYAKDGKVMGTFAILAETGCTGDTHAKARLPAQVDTSDVSRRLISALELDEFVLHCQAIVPSAKGSRETSFNEVLLRMKEEEEKHIPPGTFLPLAEELGQLHEIDRWVVRKVVDFAARSRRSGEVTFFVNLSAPTISDKDFAPFVRGCLKSARVPDHTLCFELPEQDVLANPAAYRDFVGALDGTGCRFAVSGFGCHPLSLRLLKQLRVDFLKIEGGAVLGMLANPGGLAKVKAINLAAHAAGMRTIAECVEDDATRTALEAIETDFVQGFGIAMPIPLVVSAQVVGRPVVVLEPREPHMNASAAMARVG